jgi:PAS domain S-box-containing protein
MESPLKPPPRDPPQLAWRSIAVGLWIAVLVAAGLWYGARRRDALLERRIEELLDGVGRVTEALALPPADARGLEPMSAAGRFVRVGADGGELATRDREAWQQLASGVERVHAGGEWWIAARAGDERLVALVPDAALEERLAPERGELTFVLWASGLAILVTALTMAWVVRRRLWDFRARATAEYVVAIRREGAKWKALTDNAADMILIVDPKTAAIAERNRAAAATIGQRSLAECLSEQDLAELRAGMDSAHARPGEAVALRELNLRALDGHELRVDVRLSDIDLGHTRVVELSLRDVTRERAMERQLAISERLTSLGLLTAGVAHEINNPLEGIGNYLTLLGREDVPQERRVRYLEQVGLGFERIRGIVRDLLAFGRPGVERGEAELGEVVERVRKLVSYTKSAGEVEVRVRGLERPLVVPGDRGRLEQVLLNLLLNASTAMGGRGRITVTAVRDARSAEGEPCVQMLVDDEGPGIPPEHLQKIFDPFFTTTQGNGLGLSISYGILRAHGGTLSASNRPEGGARLKIELPLARPATQNLKLN